MARFVPIPVVARLTQQGRTTAHDELTVYVNPDSVDDVVTHTTTLNRKTVTGTRICRPSHVLHDLFSKLAVADVLKLLRTPEPAAAPDTPAPPPVATVTGAADDADLVQSHRLDTGERVEFTEDELRAGVTLSARKQGPNAGTESVFAIRNEIAKTLRVGRFDIPRGHTVVLYEDELKADAPITIKGT